MFKLVLLSAVLAVASAGVLHGAAYSIPTAVSHQSRTDIVSKPVVAYAAAPVVAAASYTAPVVKTVASAPVVAAAYTAPVAYTAAYPSAVSHQSRTDVVSKPVVAAYSSPIVSAAYTAPIATAAYASPLAYAASPLAYTGYATHY